MQLRLFSAFDKLYNNNTTKKPTTAQNVPRIVMTTTRLVLKNASSTIQFCLPDANITCIAFSTTVRYANVTNGHLKFLPKKELKFVCSR